jgi:hypothetical protein
MPGEYGELIPQKNLRNLYDFADFLTGFGHSLAKSGIRDPFYGIKNRSISMKGAVLPFPNGKKHSSPWDPGDGYKAKRVVRYVGIPP